MTMPNPVAEVVERLRAHAQYLRENLPTTSEQHLPEKKARISNLEGAADLIERLSRERDTGVPFTTKEWEWIASGLGNFVEYVMPDGEETEVRALLKKVEALSAAPQPPQAHPASGTGVPEGFRLVPSTAIDWLLGEGPDANGNYFGDEYAYDFESGRYWWRSELRAMLSAPQPPTVSEGASSDLPDEIYVERDAETNEKRWFSCKGMGEKYVHARLLDNWKFVAKHGLAKVTPEHTWAQWLAEMEADLSTLTRERDQAREALANLIADCDDYARINNLAGTWATIERARSLLQKEGG